MFKELAPYLRQRAVLLTVTHIEDDQIRVNVIPQKLKDGENAALTTPLTVTGTADELDRDLPATLVNFVSAHLQLRNTLDRAKAEMDAAAKTAQAEARSKTKTMAKKEPPKPETTAPTDTPSRHSRLRRNLRGRRASSMRLRRRRLGMNRMRKRRFWPNPLKMSERMKSTTWTRLLKRQS